MNPATSTPAVRHALPHERIAIGAARWPGLPSWAGSAGTLRVAVAGRRDLLLGCAWELAVGEGIEAGIALSPAPHRAMPPAEALIGSFHPHPIRTIHWSEWLDLDDPRTVALRQSGFVEERQMMAYRIPRRAAGHGRLDDSFAAVSARLTDAGITWGNLDEHSLADVRLACLQEKLMSSHEFDFHHHAGGFDAGLSPVAWQNEEMVGFIVAMTGSVFEVALLYVHPRLRRAGLNTLLMAEVVRRKMRVDTSWTEVVFRGNPDANLRSRRMCQRFGGSEDVACVKLCLPPK